MQEASHDVSQVQADYSAAILAAEHALDEYKYKKVDSNASEVRFTSSDLLNVVFHLFTAIQFYQTPIQQS